MIPNEAMAIHSQRGIKTATISSKPITIIDPATNPKTEDYINLLVELRQAKGMTYDKAKALVLGDNLYYGCMMVKCGDVDGMVGGSVRSTGDVLRPALQIIKTKPGTSW